MKKKTALVTKKQVQDMLKSKQNVTKKFIYDHYSSLSHAGIDPFDLPTPGTSISQFPGISIKLEEISFRMIVRANTLATALPDAFRLIVWQDIGESGPISANSLGDIIIDTGTVAAAFCSPINFLKKGKTFHLLLDYSHELTPFNDSSVVVSKKLPIKWHDMTYDSTSSTWGSGAVFFCLLTRSGATGTSTSYDFNLTSQIVFSYVG
jgi:hypothetical protein